MNSINSIKNVKKKSTPRHIIIKLLKISDKKKALNQSEHKDTLM